MIIFSKPGERDKQKLFSLLTLELLKDKKNVINLSFNCSERYFYKQFGIKSLEVNKEKILNSENSFFSEKEINEMIKFEKETRENFNEKKWLEVTKKYIDFLEELRKKGNLEFAIMWNTSYLFDRILYFFCRKHNIKYFVMEQGYFRPFTLSFDAKGVNSEASISKNSRDYKDIKIDLDKYREYLNKPITAKENKIEKHNEIIYSILRLYEKTKIDLNKNNIWDITERNLIQFFNKKMAVKKFKKYHSVKKIEGKYIFIPFQVEGDSQIILNSDKIKKMFQLYKVVAETMIKLNEKRKEKIKAVFKFHPMDEYINVEEILNLEKKYEETIFFMGGNTQELIKNAEAVITINSTVGVEALMEHKPVVTLGDAFYNIDGITYHCDKLEELSGVLEKALTLEPNKELIDKFLYYLRFHYFKEIYWRNPDEESIKKIVKEIVEDEK